MGAALGFWHQELKMPRLKFRDAMKGAYLGPKFNNETIDKKLRFLKANFEKKTPDQIISITAKELANKRIVGWFQGKMEWGPRALGNRSILGDPRRSDMKDILNLKIKRRESFRPFAPSILREHVSEWFENDDEVPFMMKVYQIKESKRLKIPAVTHIDGSGRLQTVYKETNEKYHDLINEFYKLTNIPILLNTSFNENEPIVSKPEEALDCFLRTKMDTLVMGNYIIKRY